MSSLDDFLGGVQDKYGSNMQGNTSINSMDFGGLEKGDDFAGRSLTGPQAQGIAKSIGGVVDAASDIVGGVMKNKSIENAQQKAIQQTEEARNVFFEEMNSVEEKNEEDRELEKEKSAIRAKDEEMSMKLKRWQFEFAKAAKNQQGLAQAASRLLETSSRNPNVAKQKKWR